MARRAAIEASLDAWRQAERDQAKAIDGDREAITRRLELHRSEYQRLSAEGMAEWIALLNEAEGRRANATPSTLPFHVAARDTQEIASQIWEAARSSDEDTPKTVLNRRRTLRPESVDRRLRAR